MLPNTGLETGAVHRRVLLICGESTRDVLSAFETLGVRFSKIAECREFRSFDCEYSVPFTTCIAGLGSASVEVALTELALCGGGAFVLSGTCGALSKTHTPGQVVIPDTALRCEGASFHYLPGPRLTAPHPDDLRLAREILGAAGIAHGNGRIVSTDTFYCMGAAADDKGAPAYPGLPLKDEFSPPPGFSDLKDMLDAGKPYLIDMETAALYAICSALRDRVFNISVKTVANYVPFVPGEQAENTAACMRSALTAACEIIRGI